MHFHHHGGDHGSLGKQGGHDMGGRSFQEVPPGKQDSKCNRLLN